MTTSNKTLVSVISTVYMEEKTIKQFLNSLLNQSFKPDEIVITVRKSKDRTLEIIKEYEKKYGNLIKVFELEEGNIAEGRNFAISKSNGIIIVTTDAGSEYENDYLKKIVLPLLKYMYNHLNDFKLSKEEFLDYIKNKGLSINDLKNVEEAEFVQGITVPKIRNLISFYTGNILIKRNQCKIPSRASARATAYFKYVWESVNGYPQGFVTGEDTLFNINVLSKKFKWVCVDAKVYWNPPLTIKGYYKKLERYAIGDAIQGNLFKSKKLLLMFSVFWVSILVLVYLITIKTEVLIKYYREFLVFIVSTYLIIGLIGLYRFRKWHSIVLYPLFLLMQIIAYNIGLLKGLMRLFSSKLGK